MTHVSSKKLDPELVEKLFGKLLVILEQAQKKGNLTLVANELFTSTEKVMLAKRLAIILMLASNTPQHRIVEILNVSPTTVAKISFGIETGRYKNILTTSASEKLNLEKLVWNILTAGGIMPPKVGRKYWTKNYKK